MLRRLMQLGLFALRAILAAVLHEVAALLLGRLAVLVIAP